MSRDVVAFDWNATTQMKYYEWNLVSNNWTSANRNYDSKQHLPRASPLPLSISKPMNVVLYSHRHHHHQSQHDPDD